MVQSKRKRTIQKAAKSRNKPEDFQGPSYNTDDLCPVCGEESSENFFLISKIHLGSWSEGIEGQVLGRSVVCGNCLCLHIVIGSQRLSGRIVEEELTEFIC